MIRKILYTPLRKLLIRLRLYRACRILGIELFPLVKDYVLHGSMAIFNTGRARGKTTACLLRALVYQQMPAEIDSITVRQIYAPDPDFLPHVMSRCKWYIQFTKLAVYKCEKKGLRVSPDWRGEW